MEEARGGKDAATPSASYENHDEDRIKMAIWEGLRKALIHKTNKVRASNALSAEEKEALLKEAFPKLSNSEEGVVGELSSEEFDVLRISLQRVVHEDVKSKIALMQDQLSEYHSVLEDVIAYQRRCQELEQEKNDLVSVCRELCQARDDRIALLEKEVAHLRNERRSSVVSSDNISGISSDMSHSEWATSIIRGVSEGYRPQDNHQHPSPSQPIPALPSPTPVLPRMNHYYSEARRITLSPTSVDDQFQESRSNNRRISRGSSNSINMGAIPALPFQRSSAPQLMFTPKSSASRFPLESVQNGNTKRQKRS